MDATYRADLRELNELNFARFDAKVEQRLGAMEARLDSRIDNCESRLNARIDRLATALEGKLDSQVAAHAFAQINSRFDRMGADFTAQLGISESRTDALLERGLRRHLGWTILMWIAVLAAVLVRTQVPW